MFGQIDKHLWLNRSANKSPDFRLLTLAIRQPIGTLSSGDKMCGYLEINGERPSPVMQLPGFEEYLPFLPINETKAYYPAFGSDPERTIDIVIKSSNGLQQVPATWWFDCSEAGDSLAVGKRTTFNARNLSSPFWRHALTHRRGIVFATGLGESKLVGKTKHQYYMQSEEIFALGTLYRQFNNGRYSCAVITRDAHPKMEAYHDKAFPCFLPMDAEFLDIWLDPNIETHPRIDSVLSHPMLYPSLEVQRVKTYKGKVPMKSPAPTVLVSDLLA